MDISNRNIDSTGPRRRLTQDLNKRPPISLATHRRSGTIRTIADHAGSSQNAVYDDDFIAQKYDTQPSTGRRRTVQLNDFINTQTSAGSSSNIDLLYSSNRDFAKTEEQQLLSSQSRNNNLSIPIKPSTSMYDPIYNMSLASTGDLDKARLMEENRELRQREKQYMDKLDRYERQLEELAIKFQQYKDLRTTKQEEVLAEHMTISQMKDDAYVQLRDHVEALIEKDTAQAVDTAYNQQRAPQKKLKQEAEPQIAQLPGETDSKLKEFVMLYEELTSVITIDVKNTKEGRCHTCIMAGQKGSFHFTITFLGNKEGDLVYYSPSFDSRDKAFQSSLPELYQENAAVPKEYLPIFFANLSAVVNVVEENR